MIGLMILGLASIYSWIHFAVIQIKKNYKSRTGYEKVVTWFALVTLTLYVISTL